MTASVDLTARLVALSARHLSVPPDLLRPEALLVDDLGIDSLAAIEWGTTIEDAFGVALPEDAWQSVSTFGEVDALVRRLADAVPDTAA